MAYTMIPRQLLVLSFTILVVSGCAHQPLRQFDVNTGRMSTAYPASAQDGEDEQAYGESERHGSRFTRIQTAPRAEQGLSDTPSVALKFPANDAQQVSARDLPLKEFVHSVFSDILKVNYIITDPSKNAVRMNLNLQEPVSSRRLFTLTEDLLKQHQLQIIERENIFYISPEDQGRSDAVMIGMGRRMQDIPETSGQILQIIPLKYGVKSSIERTLNNLTSARVRPESDQGALFVQGPRQEIIRVIDLLSLLDMPSSRGRYIALTELTYITPKEFVDRLTELMTAEGIPVATNPNTGAAVLAITIEQIGAVAIFASSDDLLQRAEFWASTLDRPAKGAQNRYFIYHPRYARASDLGQSVAPLIGGATTGSGNRARDTQSADSGDSARSGSRGQGISVSGDDIRMTVDERSNTLVFYTQGETYQSLLPIIRRLDILPKQILLDATIAEVTLTDEFAQGFEFAFSSGRLTGGTLGALGASEMGGFRLNWGDGVSSMLARLSASSSLVNILSNPTLVVRDGVSATINVGNEIPTIGSTTINPGTETQSTTIVYRRTGVKLTVTPTINAQGLVVLEIDQSISNTSASGPQLSGSPSIFERSIQTEVIAQSGQSILLGGLISEDNSEGSSHVPGIARVPLLGQLFRGQEQSRTKTELVIFITPRVIDSVDQWQHIRQSVAQGLTSIQLSD